MTPCNVIHDLLPLYVENLVSDESRQLIEEHIAVCEECRTMLYRMQSDDSNTESSCHEDFQTVLRSHQKRNNRKKAGYPVYILPFFCLLNNSLSE